MHPISDNQAIAQASKGHAVSDRNLFHSILKVLAIKVVLLALLWLAFIRPNMRHVDAQQTAAALGLDSTVSSTSPQGVRHGQ